MTETSPMETMMSITPTTEMPLPQLRKLLEGLYAEGDKAVAEVAESSAIVYAAKHPTPQFITGHVERWGALKAELLEYRRRAARRRREAKNDFDEKYWAKAKFGPQGRQQATGFAWEERKAALQSEFIVEYTRWELLDEAVEDLNRSIAVIDAHIWNVKGNTQTDLRTHANEAKYASNKDYIGD